MHRRSVPWMFLAGLALSAAITQPGTRLAAQAALSNRLPVDSIKLPPGFSIAVYADNVPNARSLVLGPKGTLFVSTRSAGNVYALRDTNGDHRADQVITIASGLNMPNGVAFTRRRAVRGRGQPRLRYDDIEDALGQRRRSPWSSTSRSPTERHHGWKFIAFGPDGLLYVPVGAPCNICERDDRVSRPSRA